MSMPAPHIEETVARGQESGSLSSVASADPSPAGGGHAFISTGDQSGHHITPSHFVLPTAETPSPGSADTLASAASTARYMTTSIAIEI